jgi:carbonic anhydrase
VITCLDPRTDPAHLLELELGDAAVIRNAGGRVTQAVIDDLAFISYLSETVLRPEGLLFEVVVIHHNKCGTSFLADADFRRKLPTKLIVSGHVYDVDTGLVTTVVPPSPLRTS